MRRMRTHAHENREPATTRWVRAAAQRAHFGASTPPIFETGAITSKFVRAGIDCLERPEDCIACIQN
jgi:hypothetical protein